MLVVPSFGRQSVVEGTREVPLLIPNHAGDLVVFDSRKSRVPKTQYLTFGA